MTDIIESVKSILLDKTCHECNFMLEKCVLHINPPNGISCTNWEFIEDPTQTFVRMFDFSDIEEVK
jgi:hypothetical protein